MIVLNLTGTTTFPIRLKQVQGAKEGTYTFLIKNINDDSITEVVLTDISEYPYSYQKFEFDNDVVQLRPGTLPFTVIFKNEEEFLIFFIVFFIY